MSRKIVLIGAGSAMFTRGLVADLLSSRELGEWELGLVDIDPKALDVALNLTRRMVEIVKSPLKVTAGTARKDVLPDADVVVTTIAVGGRRAWEADVLIPRKYGVYQPVGDTAMSGGLSRALRMIPAMVAIAQDVKELCPKAFFFNYSNPMTPNCRAIRKVTGVPVVGLCHGVNAVEGYLAECIGVPQGEVTSLGVGLNHFTLMYDFRHKGVDAWDRIRAKLPKLREHNPFSWGFFEAYRAYPAVHDRHVVEFFPERFPNGRYEGKTLGVDVFSFERTIEDGDRIYREMREQATGRSPIDPGLFNRGPGEHEQLLEMVSAIYADRRTVYSVNMPNHGVVPSLPDHAVLELPAVATARGFRQIYVGDFPERLAALLTKHIARIEVTVEAALTGERDLFVEALLLDGSVQDRATAEKLADELIAAHWQNLPQFGKRGDAVPSHTC